MKKIQRTGLIYSIRYVIEISFHTFNISIVVICIHNHFPQLSFLHLSNTNTQHSCCNLDTIYLWKKKYLTRNRQNDVPLLVKITSETRCRVLHHGIFEIEREKSVEYYVSSIPITRRPVTLAIIFSDRRWTRLEQAATDIRNGNKSKTEHFR